MTIETEVINEEVANIVNEEAPEPPPDTKIEQQANQRLKQLK